MKRFLAVGLLAAALTLAMTAAAPALWRATHVRAGSRVAAAHVACPMSDPAACPSGCPYRDRASSTRGATLVPGLSVIASTAAMPAGSDRVVHATAGTGCPFSDPSACGGGCPYRNRTTSAGRTASLVANH